MVKLLYLFGGHSVRSFGDRQRFRGRMLPLRSLRPGDGDAKDFDAFKDEHPWGSGNKMANVG